MHTYRLRNRFFKARQFTIEPTPKQRIKNGNSEQRQQKKSIKIQLWDMCVHVLSQHKYVHVAWLLYTTE